MVAARLPLYLRFALGNVHSYEVTVATRTNTRLYDVKTVVPSRTRQQLALLSYGGTTAIWRQGTTACIYKNDTSVLCKVEAENVNIIYKTLRRWEADRHVR